MAFIIGPATDENATTEVSDCCASFGTPNGLLSDLLTHFKHETMRGLKKALKLSHHATLPYNPWNHEAVEILGKEVLRTFRSIILYLELDFQ